MVAQLENAEVIGVSFDAEDIDATAYVDDRREGVLPKTDQDPGSPTRLAAESYVLGQVDPPKSAGLMPCPVDFCVGDMWSDGLRHTSDLNRKRRNPLPDGTVIYVAPGKYEHLGRQHCTAIRGNKIRIKGIVGANGGRPHVFARPDVESSRRSLCGQALWLISGDDVTVENFIFSGAHVRDENGAGIRLQGINLTVRGSLFYENDMGVRGGPTCNINRMDKRIRASFFRIERSTFKFMRNHNIYVACVGTLYFIDSVTAANGLPNRARHDDVLKDGSPAWGGKHLLKSVAHNLVVENSKFLDTFENFAGNSSYLIDISGCGTIRIADSEFLKNARAVNRSTMINIGVRGCEDAKPGKIPVQIKKGDGKIRFAGNVFSDIRITNNRFIDKRGVKSIVRLRADWPVTAEGNFVNGIPIALSDLVRPVSRR